MNKKNDVEVVIGGKQYTLSGYESAEYIQKIASHINQKLSEFREKDWYRHLDQDMKTVLMSINLADDYYKVKEELEEIKFDTEEKEKDFFDMKIELINLQKKYDELNKEHQEILDKKEEDEKKIIRLETQREQWQNNLTVARSETSSIRTEKNQLEKQVKELQDELSRVKQTLETLQKENAALQEEKSKQDSKEQAAPLAKSQPLEEENKEQSNQIQIAKVTEQTNQIELELPLDDPSNIVSMTNTTNNRSSTNHRKRRR